MGLHRERQLRAGLTRRRVRPPELCKGRYLHIAAAIDNSNMAMQHRSASVAAFGRLARRSRNCSSDGVVVSVDDRYGHKMYG